MIISISGLPGAGKSALAKALAVKLNWLCYSMGNLRRQTAKDQGLSLAEFNKLGETDPQTDLTVDEYQQKLGQEQDNFVIEGRTSWHFIPQSYKIFLTVDPQIGAQRIWHDLQANDQRNEDRDLQSVEDVKVSNQERIASDTKRYDQYFQINAYDPANYDFVLDTSRLSLEEMVEKVYRQIVQQLPV
ncbi:MAG: (d)CMP kinase [bacterium]